MGILAKDQGCPLLLGMSFILIGLSVPRPSYRHFAQTSKFLILSRGGPIETKYVQSVWLDVLFLIGVGLGFFYMSYLFLK